MSRRDLLLVGGLLTVFIGLGVLFRPERDDATDAQKSTPVPIKTSEPGVTEAMMEYLSKPQEERAFFTGGMVGEELGSNRVPLSRQVIQDAIYKYDHDLVVEPHDIRETCEAVWNYDKNMDIPEFAASLGVKRAYIAALLAAYADDAPYVLHEYCASTGAKSDY